MGLALGCVLQNLGVVCVCGCEYMTKAVMQSPDSEIPYLEGLNGRRGGGALLVKGLHEPSTCRRSEESFQILMDGLWERRYAGSRGCRTSPVLEVETRRAQYPLIKEYTLKYHGLNIMN